MGSWPQEEIRPWNPRLGTSYALGVDGISLPMVLLATLLSFVAILSSGHIRERAKWYFVLVLVLETAMLGVFMAQDWALFYIFWELTLIPLFFLIDRWGGQRRHTASLNFVLYTMGGSVFMLISLLLVFDSIPDKSFSMLHMALEARVLSEHQQIHGHFTKRDRAVHCGDRNPDINGVERGRAHQAQHKSPGFAPNRQ